jgi:hypothetical protein
MDNLLTAVFEAHHAEKNHHRRYQLTVGRDLLDAWTVAITYGRTGQAGRVLRYASARPDDMKAIIRDRLRRRLSAPRRIDCSYRLAAFSAAPGFDAAAWLPGDVMARFFESTRPGEGPSKPIRSAAATGLPPGPIRPAGILG